MCSRSSTKEWRGDCPGGQGGGGSPVEADSAQPQPFQTAAYLMGHNGVRPDGTRERQADDGGEEEARNEVV